LPGIAVSGLALHRAGPRSELDHAGALARLARTPGSSSARCHARHGGCYPRPVRQGALWDLFQRLVLSTQHHPSRHPTEASILRAPPSSTGWRPRRASTAAI
jgi:hypothetical protein